MGKKAALFEEAQRMYVQEGATLEEISRRLDVSVTSLSIWKNEGMWQEARMRYLKSEQHFSGLMEELKSKLVIRALENP
ncbi:MAG: hypothetical protein SV375_11360, partial [Thermodesulfobacteriota bacterium]|nr:hypothetical protein [Thermodesulfobacteriota bacterium]